MKKIAHPKPRNQTLVAYVREALEIDLRRRQLGAAAKAYQKMLADNGAERHDLEEWEKAALRYPLKPARK